jgi:uncharacterized protein YndB with AHSA1/START domain
MATIEVTPDQDVITGEIFIAAPPERVFQAITDPNQMPQWWGQPNMYRVTECKADLRPGGKWSSTGVSADGTSFVVDGEYLEIDAPRLLVCTWIPSFAGRLKTVLRWELEPRQVHGLQHRGPQKVGTGTLVKIHHSGFAGYPEAAKGHTQGWTRVLGWLQAFTENGETIDTRKPFSAA